MSVPLSSGTIRTLPLEPSRTQTPGATCWVSAAGGGVSGACPSWAQAGPVATAIVSAAADNRRRAAQDFVFMSILSPMNADTNLPGRLAYRWSQQWRWSSQGRRFVVSGRGFADGVAMASLLT